MKKSFVSCWVLVGVLSASAAIAQQAPPPRAMPRVPVSRETLQDRHELAPASRQVQGGAMVLDGEKLRVAETDLRLFGIVPPQLAASFGPQARATLDALTSGQNVSCLIRDRDRDGRLLATCQASGVDLALELLKRGLAVTARGSLAGTDVATAYLGAEEGAQKQKIGLWSVMIPPAATPVIAPVAASALAPPTVAVQLPEPVAPTAPAVVAAAAAAPKDDAKIAPRTDKATSASTTSAQQTTMQAKIAADIEAQHAEARVDDDRWAPEQPAGFFERYQILIAGFLMLGTALSVVGALWAQKRRDKSDETKAAAAALRGELMAARGVCLGRIRTIANDDEDRASAWPRIRSTLYNAYVGRLGLLGAELARQVSSIYGQSGDYAAFYSPTVGAAHDSPKKHALETLVRHIDEVLPRLAALERSGSVLALTYGDRPYYATSTLVSPPAHRAYLPHTTQAASVQEQDEVEEEAPAPESHAPEMREYQVTPSPTALWETVRGFIQNHRNAIAANTAGETEAPADPISAEYAAMIEADMVQYHYGVKAGTLLKSKG